MAPIYWFVSVFSVLDLLAGGWFIFMNYENAESEHDSEYSNYFTGKSHWWNVHSNEAEYLKKIQHCQTILSNVASWSTFIGCKLQIAKVNANYFGASSLQYILYFGHHNSKSLIVVAITSVFMITLLCVVDKRLNFLRKMKSWNPKFSNPKFQSTKTSLSEELSNRVEYRKDGTLLGDRHPAVQFINNSNRKSAIDHMAEHSIK